MTGNHYVDISEDSKGGYLFCCSEEDFENVWIPYFDLCSDYRAYQKMMVGDPFLENAIQIGGGIRILNQDPWETVVSFTISQRNNIPRIRKCIAQLCKKYGSLLGWLHGEHPVFAFPTPSQLSEKDLSDMGLGYRAKYVESLARNEGQIWEDLRDLPDELLHSFLLDRKGIGEKVANCIMLFGYHRLGSYPRDVWINRMIDDVYHGDFTPDRYSWFAGYVQQLQFYYYRQLTKGVRE